MESPITLGWSYAVSPRKQELPSKVCHTRVPSEEETKPYKIGTRLGKRLVIAKVKLTTSAGLSTESVGNPKTSAVQIFPGGAPPFCSLEVLRHWQMSSSESQRIRSLPS